MCKPVYIFRCDRKNRSEKLNAKSDILWVYVMAFISTGRELDGIFDFRSAVRLFRASPWYSHPCHIYLYCLSYLMLVITPESVLTEIFLSRNAIGTRVWESLFRRKVKDMPTPKINWLVIAYAGHLI